MKTEHSRSYVTLFTTIAGGKRSFFSPKYNIEIASNLSQPWVLPIKRGKGGGKDTEFGMKINASVSGGMTRMDYGSFDAFHEGLGLKDQVEAFKELYG